MPNIKPVSDLRNYTEVLKEVGMGNPVYLTRNGRGEFAIVRMEDLDELLAMKKLFAALSRGEASARENGWIPADELEAELGVHIEEA